MQDSGTVKVCLQRNLNISVIKVLHHQFDFYNHLVKYWQMHLLQELHILNELVIFRDKIMKICDGFGLTYQNDLVQPNFD